MKHLSHPASVICNSEESSGVRGEFALRRRIPANSTGRMIKFKDFHLATPHEFKDLNIEQWPFMSYKERQPDIICLLMKSHNTPMNQSCQKNYNLNLIRLQRKLSVYKRYKGQRSSFYYSAGMQSAKPKLWDVGGTNDVFAKKIKRDRGEAINGRALRDISANCTVWSFFNLIF